MKETGSLEFRESRREYYSKLIEKENFVSSCQNKEGSLTL